MVVEPIATIAIAGLATCLFVWALIPIARRIGLVDRPGGRKSHNGEVPTIGGVAIVTAVIATALVMGISDQAPPAFWAGLLVIVLVGTLDDLRGLGHRSKFLAQVVAAALMIFWAGWSLHSLGNLLGNWPLGLGRLAIPLTFIAVIGVVNAINITDGADGLAGGLVFNALLWLAIMAVAGANGSAEQVQIALAFLGAVAGFLAFNLRLPGRKQALIFLGDAGSLGLGYVLAWFMVWGAERPEALFAPVTAIWLVAVPLMETLTCAGRRILNGQSPFKADRKHLHHILVDLGLSPRAAVTAIHGSAFVLGAIGVGGWYFEVPQHVMFYTGMAIFTIYVLSTAEALRVIEARQVAAPEVESELGQEQVLLPPGNRSYQALLRSVQQSNVYVDSKIVGLGNRSTLSNGLPALKTMTGYQTALSKRGRAIKHLTNPVIADMKVRASVRHRQRRGRA